MPKGSENDAAISFDDLFTRRDELASEPFPPRKDEQEYVFEAGAKARASCEADGSTVRIRTIGDLIKIEPKSNDGARVSMDEFLSIAKKVAAPEAFRPKWLDFMTAPASGRVPWM